MTEATIANPRLEHALTYAARGWRIIPLHWPRVGPGTVKCSCGDSECASIGKHPRTAHGLHDASANEVVIRAWWNECAQANVGIVTGAGSGIVVLDVDPDNGGDQSLVDLTLAYGDLPETFQVSTGGGGTHYFFTHPGYKLPNSASKLGLGLDIRGDGGYVVAPPSLHMSRNRYAQVTPHEPTTMPAWMLAELAEAEPVQYRQQGTPSPQSLDETCRHWLGKALSQSVRGRRNDMGFWLACQLRDAGVSEMDAHSPLRQYAQLVTSSDDPYTEKEAANSIRSAYHEPARDPARGTPSPRNVDRQPVEVKMQPPPPSGAAAELSAYIDSIIAGDVVNLPWPWECWTKWTQSLIPGSATVICGDPGVGKTFLVLQCLEHWRKNGIDAAAFFIEKDRKFHTMRLLAMLEGNGKLVDFDWCQNNPAVAQAAMERHRAQIDSLGKMIESQPQERVTLQSLAAWIRQRASAGKKVLVIDPITAADAGMNRWLADDAFVDEVNKIITAHGTRLVLVTHPKKGNRPGDPTASDLAAGAAYNRFVDANIWLFKPKKPRAVVTRCKFGIQKQTLALFAQIHKARNGRGAGMMIGMTFDGSLRFAEQGIVLKEATNQGQGVDPAPAHDPIEDVM